MDSSEYIIGHLITTDIIAAVSAYFVRKMIDLYQVHEKIVNRDEKWSWSYYIERNYIRWIASFVVMCALLVALPEFVVWFCEATMDYELVWNTGFSFIIGYGPIEILFWCMRRFKRKANTISKTIDGNNEVNK